MADAWIGGVGITNFGEHSGRSIVSMGAEAARMALLDAAVEPDQIQAAFFSNVLAPRLFGDMTIGQDVLNEVGMCGLPVVNVENACASGSTAFYLAVTAVRAGQADVAIVVGAEKMHVPELGLLNSGETAIGTLLGAVVPASFALRAQRHMVEFGTTSRQLAMVSVKNRRHAEHNPIAVYRKPVTVDEVMASPMIADPLTRLQSCPNADGAAAVVVMSDAAARRYGAKVRVASAVLCTGTYAAMPDFARWETDYRAAKLAYEQAGLGPKDVNVVECHDAFSIGEILHCEALGLCQPGEGGRLVEDGVTALGGRVPVNPSGGLLSRGHPLGATAVAQLVELTHHLRGQAGERQVANARVGLAQCMGADKDGDTKSCTVAILTH